MTATEQQRYQAQLDEKVERLTALLSPFNAPENRISIATNALPYARRI